MKTLALFLVGCFLLVRVGAESSRPNIIFIFTDDHATQALSAYGDELSKFAPTPNIDRIADEGMLFKRCYVGNSICGPSRASILTGTHSHINGMETNFTIFDGSQQTFPKLLQQHDYQTAIIGKWHLKSTPTGFDHWEVLYDQGYYYNPDFVNSAGLHQEVGYVTDVITDKAITWMEHKRDIDQPFMLMVQHKAPHREWSPAPRHLALFEDVVFPEPETLFDDYAGRGTAARDQDMSISKSMELGKDNKLPFHDESKQLAQRTSMRMNVAQRKQWERAYAKRNSAFRKAKLKGQDLVRWKYQRYMQDYLACVRGVDEGVGRILDYLEVAGLAENTVVVYSSDQGFYLGEHGWFDKRFMYEESFRTPLLVRWPGVVEAHSVNTDLVSNIDFAQTFLDIAGVQEVPERMQGASLLPILNETYDREKWRDSIYYRYAEFPKWHHVHPHEGVATDRYKLMHFFTLNEWELYDLEKDPQEMRNQYSNSEYADIVAALKAELIRLKEVYNAPGV